MKKWLYHVTAVLVTVVVVSLLVYSNTRTTVDPFRVTTSRSIHVVYNDPMIHDTSPELKNLVS